MLLLAQLCRLGFVCLFVCKAYYLHDRMFVHSYRATWLSFLKHFLYSFCLPISRLLYFPFFSTFIVFIFHVNVFPIVFLMVGLEHSADRVLRQSWENMPPWCKLYKCFGINGTKNSFRNVEENNNKNSWVKYKTLLKFSGDCWDDNEYFLW